MTIKTYATPGAYDWWVPAGVTEITVTAIGGGGPGSSGGAGRGGGGGGCGRSVLAVTPGIKCRIVVGSPANASGFAFSAITWVLGFGGLDGDSGGLGGAWDHCVGDTRRSGGDGGLNDPTGAGGGGGGSASSTADGGDGTAGSGSTGGAGGTGDGPGGAGGDGGQDGQAGGAPGGGGGGGAVGYSGGAGAAGRVTLEYSGESSADHAAWTTAYQADTYGDTWR